MKNPTKIIKNNKNLDPSFIFLIIIKPSHLIVQIVKLFLILEWIGK